MWLKSFDSRFLSAVVLLTLSVSSASAQTPAFTYQGKLTDGANPANGNYDMQFKLFDTATVGTGAQQGPTITNSSVPVTAGIFTVQLDFGAGVFSGLPRFLEIGVRQMGSPDPYTLLSPRQAVTSTPYSVRSLNSSVADVLSSACVGCVTSTQIGSVSGAAVTGAIPVASVPAGSTNYIQNSLIEQGGNFNIHGNGVMAGSISASSANFSGTATANIFNAATQFNIGGNRAFSFGSSAAVFVGRLAGESNTTGSGNSFFGDSAGRFNTTASNNSFFGRDAGTLNTASDNSFFGAFAGDSNTTGTRNAFFGRTAGDANQTGNDNSFFGYNAGKVNTAGFNAFFGSGAGDSNTSGAGNTFFGYNAGSANVTSVNNAFFGHKAGLVSTAGNNTFIGSQAGAANTSGTFNTFVGTFAGNTNTTGNHNTIIGYGADVDETGGPLSYATAIGAGAVVDQGNTIVLGRSVDNVRVPGGIYYLNVNELHAASYVFVGNLDINGSTPLCWNTGYHSLATCSSSLRYKTNVQTFARGLDVVRRLRPITFNWKDGGMHDVGFGAEDVEQVEPLLTTRNSKGEIEGVKYGQITTVLVNAVQQQQAQIAEHHCTIEQQQRQISEQRRELAALKRLVCLDHPNTEVCKQEALR